MRAGLLAVAGPLAGSNLTLALGQTSIGRDGANAVTIADPAVSPHHCVLVFSGGEVTIRDCDRRNPTFINGLPAGETALHDGDEVQIGGSLFALRLEADQPRPEKLLRIEQSLPPPPGMILLRREDVFEPAPPQQSESPERLSRDLATLMRTSAAINAVRGL